MSGRAWAEEEENDDLAGIDDLEDDADFDFETGNVEEERVTKSDVKVMKLTRKNFVKETKFGRWLVMVRGNAMECPLCDRMLSGMREVRAASSGIKLGYVDAHYASDGLGWDVKFMPMIFYSEDGFKNKRLYVGDNDQDGLKMFSYRMQAPVMKRLHTDDQVEEILRTKDKFKDPKTDQVSFFYITDSKKSWKKIKLENDYKTLHAVAEERRPTHHFYEMSLGVLHQKYRDELASLPGDVPAFPWLIRIETGLFGKGEDGPVMRYTGVWNQEDMATWIDQWQFPRVMEMNFANFHLLKDEGRRLVMCITFAAYLDLKRGNDFLKEIKDSVLSKDTILPEDFFLTHRVAMVEQETWEEWLKPRFKGPAPYYRWEIPAIIIYDQETGVFFHKHKIKPIRYAIDKFLIDYIKGKMPEIGRESVIGMMKADMVESFKKSKLRATFFVSVTFAFGLFIAKTCFSVLFTFGEKKKKKKK